MVIKFEKLQKFGKFFIGIMGGFVVGLWLHVVLMCYIWYYLFFLVAICASVGGAIMIKIKTSFTYFASCAALGSTLLMRGISAFISGYPNDLQFYDEYKRDPMGIAVRFSK